MTKHVTAGDVMRGRTGKSLIFLYESPGKKFCLGEQKPLKPFYLGGISPMPACRCVPDSDPYNFLAIYKFSNNQEKLLFLPLLQQQK